MVLVGFLALIIALGALHSFLEDGALIEHALQSSSHAIERICSGSYFARVFRRMQQYINDPSLLEQPPREVVEDY